MLTILTIAFARGRNDDGRTTSPFPGSEGSWSNRRRLGVLRHAVDIGVATYVCGSQTQRAMKDTLRRTGARPTTVLIIRYRRWMTKVVSNSKERG